MSRPPPRYSDIVTEASSIQPRFSTIIPSRYSTELPELPPTPLYREGDECAVIRPEVSILNQDFVKDDLQGLVQAEVSNRLTIPRGSKVVVRSVKSRKCVVVEGKPASTVYALYTVVHYIPTLCTLPRGERIAVKKSDLKKDQDDTKAYEGSFSNGDFCYMFKTVRSAFAGSLVSVREVIPTSGATLAMSLQGGRNHYYVQVVESKEFDLPYIIDRHLVHDDLTDLPPSSTGTSHTMS